jgi:hypothetical protein
MSTEYTAQKQIFLYHVYIKVYTRIVGLCELLIAYGAHLLRHRCTSSPWQLAVRASISLYSKVNLKWKMHEKKLPLTVYASGIYDTGWEVM